MLGAMEISAEARLGSSFLDVICARSSPGAKILLIGCGGGYDIFSGIPLFAALRARNRQPCLANLTFVSSFRKSETCELLVDKSLWRVHAQTKSEEKQQEYFPELFLSEFLQEPVFTIERRGPSFVKLAYQWLLENLNPEVMVLVDGGSDSLCRGDGKLCLCYICFV